MCDRQTDRQTDRQAETETQRETETERQTETERLRDYSRLCLHAIQQLGQQSQLLSQMAKLVAVTQKTS